MLRAKCAPRSSHVGINVGTALPTLWSNPSEIRNKPNKWFTVRAVADDRQRATLSTHRGRCPQRFAEVPHSTRSEAHPLLYPHLNAAPAMSRARFLPFLLRDVRACDVRPRGCLMLHGTRGSCAGLVCVLLSDYISHVSAPPKLFSQSRGGAGQTGLM